MCACRSGVKESRGPSPVTAVRTPAATGGHAERRKPLHCDGTAVKNRCTSTTVSLAGSVSPVDGSSPLLK